MAVTIYADEQFYKNEYLSGKAAVITAAFDFYARAASAVIRRQTYDNIGEDIPECVKMCCCELAELLYQSENGMSDKSDISSETLGNGSYSVSYGNAAERMSAVQSKTREIIKRWLFGTGLLYSGVE